MIRAVRPTDLAALRSFFKRTGVVEITTHTWPKVQPESGHISLLSVLGQVIGRQGNRRGIWVGVGQLGRLAGYVVARPRCDGMVWDVEQLHAAEEAVAIELLEHTCEKAVDAGALRVFLEVPADSAGFELARRVAFERYAVSSLVRLSAPFKVDKTAGFAARPRLRADEHGLFQLYNAAVPAPVRAAEAMTYDEWSSLHRGSKKWRPSLVGDRHQYVWELSDDLIGWLEVVYGQKSQFLELMVHPRYESMLDGMLAHALTQVSEKAAVYATAREYQAALASALQRARFQPVASVDILVRQLAARVPEPKLAPAKLGQWVTD